LAGVSHALVLHPSVHDDQALAGGAGDRGGTGIRFQRSGVSEAGSVITGLGEYPGADESTEA
jgi:hypothetical protein